MMPKSKNSRYYQDWLTKAKRDLDTAILNQRHGGYTDTTCYFCQQVAEKVLKSYLLFKGIKSLPRIHILSALLSLCKEKDGSFSQLEEACQILDRYYIETKYPASPPIDYSKKEAEKAIGLAEEILKFVEEKLKVERLAGSVAIPRKQKGLSANQMIRQAKQEYFKKRG